MAGLNKRKGTYHLRMRIPARYASIWAADGKPPTEIHRSLKTGDEREAKSRMAVVERMILTELDEKLAAAELKAEITAAPGKATTKMSHYQAIAAMTSARGFTYRTASELATAAADDKSADVMARIKSLQDAGDEPTSIEAAALLGGFEKPKRTLKQLANAMKDLNPFEVDNKNEQQLKDWKNKWLRVAQRLIDAIGRDPVVDDISRDDIVVLRDLMQVRVKDGSLDISSANKDLQYLGRMIRDHHKSLDRRDFSLPTADVRCEAVIRKKKSRKPPVPEEYLQKWVVMSNWGDTDQQLRDVLLIELETGGRGSEIFNLPPSAFVLNHPIPHIIIQEEEGDDTGGGARQIKTTASERRVPLVGVALEAALRNPEGFTRYRGNRNFSNAATKALRARGLIPTEPVSYKRMPGNKRKPVYVTAGGVRHSFEDRLAKVGVDMDTRGELMGHDVGRIRGRQHYGDKDLSERLELHLRIMIKPPLSLPSPSQSDEPDQ